MEECQRLYNIVKVTSEKLGIKTQDIKERSDWTVEVRAFIDKVTEPMLKLMYFGFKESEVESFIQEAETTLDSVIFFYLMKKVGKESKDPEEFQEKLVGEWQSLQLWKCLNDIANIVLDDFFIKKGGMCFTH